MYTSNSERTYISREIHECASTVALLKSQTVIRVFPVSGNRHYTLNGISLREASIERCKYISSHRKLFWQLGVLEISKLIAN